jgi:hypothetical protein
MKVEVIAAAALALFMTACTKPAEPVDMSQAATLVGQCMASEQHILEWAGLAQSGRITAEGASKISLAASVCADAGRTIRGTELEQPCGAVTAWLAGVTGALATYAEKRPPGDFAPDLPPRPISDQVTACGNAVSPFSSKSNP